MTEALPPKLVGRNALALWLPDNIPVAAQSFAALEAKGTPAGIPGYSLAKAFVLVTKDEIDPHLVWASPSLRSYRRVWKAVHRAHLVDDLAEWGENVDVDHVYPKSWAKLSGKEMAYVRLFPVWGEVNRSAGAGRERAALNDGSARLVPVEGILYASELQVLKIIGHPVGTASDPVSIFESEPNSK